MIGNNSLSISRQVTAQRLKSAKVKIHKSMRLKKYKIKLSEKLPIDICQRLGGI